MVNYEDVLMRDEFYNKLAVQPMKDDSNNTVSGLLDTSEITKRAIFPTNCTECNFSSQIYFRNRIIHKVGYIGKATLDGKPAIVRISNLFVISNLRLIGLGIKCWHNGQLHDGTFVSIVNTDNNTNDAVVSDKTIISTDNINHDDNNDVLVYPLTNVFASTLSTGLHSFFLGVLMGVFNLTGFDAQRTDVSGLFPSVNPYNEVHISSNVKSIKRMFSHGSTWTCTDVVNNNVIAALHIDPICDNPNFGSEIIFHHTLKPISLSWWQKSSIGRYLYIILSGINYLLRYYKG
jgi:hypothetical protein